MSVKAERPKFKKIIETSEPEEERLENKKKSLHFLGGILIIRACLVEKNLYNIEKG